MLRSTSQPDRGITANQLARLVAAWMRVAGAHETGHALRHTRAASLVEAGVDLRLVQILLGHGNIATTSRYLGTVDVDRLRSAIDVAGHRRRAHQWSGG